MGVLGKEKPMKYRIKIVPYGDSNFYFIQCKKRTGFLTKTWTDVEVGNPTTNLEGAKNMISNLKLQEQIEISRNKVTYIYF